MSYQCINCSEFIANNKEFCDSCDAELNEMVDAKETSISESLVDTKANPLFQTRELTGSIGDDPDIIANRLHKDDEGNIGYWQYVLLLIIIMILIVIVAN
ncbi:MAG: hypothetical protein ACXAD7_16615 [Candidatus Kariarchaeaceae archaeon]|jgi:hypothetical protein